MHRKVKGLLSVILTFAMVTATVAPVSADELSGERQPAETQPVIEMTEAEEEPVEQDAVQEPAAEGEPVDQDTAQEPAAEGEPVDQDTAQEPVAEAELTAADIASVVEQLMMESNRTPAEQAAAEIALASIYGDTDFDYLYGKLTADQKKFRVFSGTNISSESNLTFIENEGDKNYDVVPDANDLAAKGGAIQLKLMSTREGDLKFYRVSGWKLWKVDSNGAPESLLTDTSSTLNKIATEANFKQAVYMENNGTGTDPEVLCKQPILEAVWEVWDYSIPAYDTDGNLADTITVNAENYSTISFPDVEGVYWKMVYDDTECNLNAASEIWTNDTNGIRKIGFNDFSDSKAKLLACIDDPVSEESRYVITGQEGKNGWYTSDITISAKEGYAVRLSETDEWVSAVSVMESGTVTLYVKAASGTELPAKTLEFSIDKTAPVITGVVNGETYYSNEVPVVVTDEQHLQTVTKNTVDVEVDVANNTAYTTLTPSEDPYTIFAEDAAGNKTTCIVLVKQAQKQDGTAEFIQPGWRIGEEKPAPVVSSATNGVENITYYYKEQGAEDSAYTTTVPSEAGKYTAKAVFAATETYNEVVITSEFEILPSVPVEEVDKTAPVISGIENGKTYYGDQAVTVTDEHLSTVTVNGELVEVSNNRADITLKPSEDVYKIIAADEAGNKTECTVEVLEKWVRDGITTNGKKNLKNARMYKLGSGKWTVAGDNTVYTGGGSFYVKNGGEYDFKKK